MVQVCPLYRSDVIAIETLNISCHVNHLKIVVCRCFRTTLGTFIIGDRGAFQKCQHIRIFLETPPPRVKYFRTPPSTCFKILVDLTSFLYGRQFFCLPHFASQDFCNFCTPVYVNGKLMIALLLFWSAHS